MKELVYTIWPVMMTILLILLVLLLFKWIKSKHT